MRVLITGASGFIGRNLTENLKTKYDLLTPTHKELELTDYKAVQNYFQTNKIDVVVHSAVVGGNRPEEHVLGSLHQNLRIFFNIVRNKKYFKRMINLGSGAEYDKTLPIINVKESQFDTRVPIDEYGFFKYICSKYIEKVDYIVTLRIFGLFGKYEDYRYRFISNAMCRNLLSLPIIMTQNVFFDYMDIKDFVKIIVYFINHKPEHRFYNIGRGVKIDILTIAHKINNIAEKKSQVIVNKPGLNKEYTCNNKKLKSEFNKFAFSDFDQSLLDLYNWYQTKIRSINPGEL